MAKKLSSFDGLVFSTNREIEITQHIPIEQETLLPEKQNLRVSIDKRNRGGKVVTLITGFIGNHQDLESLCKQIKTKCGVGGSAKEGEMIIQGNHKDKILNILKSLGYSAK